MRIAGRLRTTPPVTVRIQTTLYRLEVVPTPHSVYVRSVRATSYYKLGDRGLVEKNFNNGQMLMANMFVYVRVSELVRVTSDLKLCVTHTIS